MNTLGNNNGNEFQPERDNASCDACSQNVRNHLEHMRLEQSSNVQSPRNEEPGSAKKWLRKLKFSYTVINFVYLILRIAGFDDTILEFLKHLI